ncbi:unnamed protein product [Protopolystoma xenopodis]|uniref:Uncharacterized protein n=1 Tax=Protopolystoma xenopodis TaxID=117903 RepID=A0A3S4ZTI6_9PLAT|nr:unnamed protein product [Protopolystoma xenopodis]
MSTLAPNGCLRRFSVVCPCEPIPTPLALSLPSRCFLVALSFDSLFPSHSAPQLATPSSTQLTPGSVTMATFASTAIGQLRRQSPNASILDICPRRQVQPLLFLLVCKQCLEGNANSVSVCARLRDPFRPPLLEFRRTQNPLKGPNNEERLKATDAMTDRIVETLGGSGCCRSLDPKREHERDLFRGEISLSQAFSQRGYAFTHRRR